MKSAGNEKRKMKKAQASTAEEKMKMKTLLDKQEAFKKQVLARLYQGAVVIEMRKQLEEHRNNDIPIRLQWFGMSMPEPILALEHDMRQQQYKELLREEQGMRDELLKEFKMTKEEVEGLLTEGKMVKEVRK